MRSLRLLLLCGIAVAPLAARAGNRTLQTPTRFFAGNTTPLTSVFAGDFTADGKQDVLIAESGKIRVMPGTGDGVFGAAIVSDASIYRPEGLADFNGDARPDLYLIGTGGELAVMPGAANGTFGAPVQVGAYSTAGALVAADFTGDGLRDLGVLSGIGEVVVLPGDGNGGFPSSQVTPIYLSGSLYDAASGDFDGDGHVDIALVTNYTTIVAWNSGSSFTTETIVSSQGIAAAAGDVNGDGKADLIVTGGDGTSISFGNSARGLVAVRSPGGASGNGLATVAMLDGDTRPDVLLGGGMLTVLTHDGAAFRRAHSFASGEGSSGIAAADFTGDGKTDVVAAHASLNGSTIDYFSLFRGNGDGTLAADPIFNVGAALGTEGWGGALFLADVNGDSKLDVIADTYLQDDIAVLFGRGDGTFEPPVLTHLPDTSYGSMYDAGDLNGDGQTDVVLWDPGAVYETITYYVLTGQANGTFAAGAAQTTPNGTGTAARVRSILDYTGDGKRDLLDTGGRLLPGLGNGTFDTAIPTGISTWAADSSIADVNGDARPDLLIGTGSVLQTHLNAGGGAFAAPVETARFGIRCAADMNGDGLADLINSVVSFSDGAGHYTGSGFAIDLRENCVTADVDGDGKPDVATGAGIYFGDGAGKFDAAVQTNGIDLTTGYGNGQILSTADLDGNASPDLWIVNGALVRIVPTRVGGNGTAAATVAVSTSPNPGPYPSAIRPVATVGGATVRARGAVLFSYASVPSALRFVGLAGAAADAHSSSPIGTATGITAAFLGDEYYGPGSASSSHTMERGPSSITVNTNKNTYQVGQTIVITSQLGGNYGGSPTGTVTYRKGDTVIATLPASASQGQTFTDPLLFPVGTHVVTSSYSGDDNFLPTQSSPRTITINKVTPAMTLAVTAGPLNDTQQVTMTASFPNQPDASGFVSFTCFGQALGNVNVSSAQAVLTRTLPWGSGVCTASYGGSDRYGTTFASQSVTVYHAAMPAAPLVSAWTTPGSHFADVAISPISGASSYDIYGAIDGGAWVVRGTSSSPSFTDYVGEATVAVYAALARSGTGTTTAIGPRDIVTFVAFTDDPLVASSTTVKAIHLTELQTAVNAVRLAAGLTATTFATPAGTISAAHLNSLRQALTQARGALGLPTTITDSTITPGVTRVRAIHLQELRDAVK